MYSKIHVPVDNSDHSNASVDMAIDIGRHYGSKLVGSHVYAAKLHDVRFKQMEFTLPDEYKEEQELEKQRKIHDALIARGLQLISESYVDQMDEQAKEHGLEVERKYFDGRNFEEIVTDIHESDYDLMIMGALGMGAVKQSEVGSVCERVLRRAELDTLIIRDPEVNTGAAPGPLLVALDGSTRSYGGLKKALGFAKIFEKTVIVVAAQDNESPEDAFLAAHLKVAEELGRREGVAVETRLVEGNARAVITAVAEEVSPWAISVGRTGIDAREGADCDIGSTAEQIVRKGEWNVLVASQEFNPAEEMGETAAA